MTSPITAFFKQYAEALMSFSAEKIAGFYLTPMAVYSDQGVQTVQEAREVRAFWEQGVKPYQAQQIKTAVPQVLNEEQLSETIFTCKVLWNNANASGNQVAQETNFYILSKQDNSFRIIGLVIMNM